MKSFWRRLVIDAITWTILLLWLPTMVLFLLGLLLALLVLGMGAAVQALADYLVGAPRRRGQARFPDLD